VAFFDGSPPFRRERQTCALKSGRRNVVILRLFHRAQSTFATEGRRQRFGHLQHLPQCRRQLWHAILSTLVTRRRQFHDLRIEEAITHYAHATQARVATLTADLFKQRLRSRHRSEASILRDQIARSTRCLHLAFNDAFLVIAIGLLVAAATIWACKEPKKAKRRAKL
jgi:hypothetical protein